MAITKNSQIDLNGNEMILDADGDTTITADTDDQIDIKVAGSDKVQINATGLGIGQVPTRDLSLHAGDASSVFAHFTNTDTGTTSSDGLLIGLGSSEDLVLNNQETGKNIIIENGGSERLRINSSGHVGMGGRLSVGTTTVGGGNTKIVATGGTDNYIQLVSNTGTGGVSLGNAGSVFLLYTHTGALGSESFSERMRIDSSGNAGIGTTSLDGAFHVKSATNKTIIADSTFSSGTFTSLAFQRNSTDKWRIFQISDDSYLGFYNDATTNTQMSLHDNDDVLFHRTDQSFNNDGTVLGSSNGSYMYMERSTGTVNSILYLHRRNGDGQLITFYESNNAEGYIQVSGSSVTLVGFTGAHDSSGSGISSSTPVGTVLSTIDEEHKQNHAKAKVSDSVGDKRVLGVLQEYKQEETDDTGNTSPEHAVVSAVGIGSVRVTGACEGGDLLESNGDGTAKVQDDDIIRSKTIGKVTIGNSDTDVKLVSCVLYCG